MKTLMKLTMAVMMNVVFTNNVIADFEYVDFSSSSSLNLVDNASVNNNRLYLTEASAWNKGAAWHDQEQNVQDGFDTTFKFQITEKDPVYNGADGFAFVIQNDSSIAIGRFGQPGYGSYTIEETNGISNSIAIEFDTYNNWNLGDPGDNHISVQSRGLLPNCTDHAYSYGVTSNISDLNDGNVHAARILYSDNLLNVFLDDLSNPCLSVNLDMSNILQLNSGAGFVGFTAGTGSGYENHDIIDWSFSEVPEPATMFLLGLGGLIFRKRR